MLNGAIPNNVFSVKKIIIKFAKETAKMSAISPRADPQTFKKSTAQITNVTLYGILIQYHYFPTF